MKKIVSLFVLMFICLSFSYSQNEIDVLTDEICEDFLSKEKEDVKIDPVEYFDNYCETKDWTINEKDKIFLNLQERCTPFLELVFSEFSIHEDWKLEETKPVSKLKEDLNRQLIKEKSFYYFQTDESVVQVDISKNTWYEKLMDGTYSDLKRKSIGKNKLSLEFLGSNNRYKSNASEKGDVFYYEILDYEKGRYLMCVVHNGGELFGTFYVYTKEYGPPKKVRETKKM